MHQRSLTGSIWHMYVAYMACVCLQPLHFAAAVPVRLIAWSQCVQSNGLWLTPCTL
jgi:hypothetical protein